MRGRVLVSGGIRKVRKGIPTPEDFGNYVPLRSCGRRSVDSNATHDIVGVGWGNVSRSERGKQTGTNERKRPRQTRTVLQNASREDGGDYGDLSGGEVDK